MGPGSPRYPVCGNQSGRGLCRQIFAAKGFEGAELEHVVEVITADDRRWIDTMIQEERGLQLAMPSAWRAGLVTFMAFVLTGSIPLAAYLVNFLGGASLPAFPLSTLMTGVAFFGVGALKSRFVPQHWLTAGAETLAVGGAAAGIAYGIGALLRGIA